MTQNIEAITFMQENVKAFDKNDDDTKGKLIKAATVFQIFLVQTLAEGKKPKDLTNEDWRIIAEKVSHYAIMSDGQQYSIFIFTLYAEYIDASVDWIIGKAMEESISTAMIESASKIKELSASIYFNTEQLQCGELSEVDYIEGCMWISLEAMIKLLACWLTRKTGPEFAYLTQAVAQLAFEYGRLVLFTREQKLLESYIENQYILDEKLQTEYEDYLEEVNRYSEKLRGLIEKAFTPDIRESLMQSAELAKASGVKEEELLTSIEDVDDFFLN
jgi:hypothetical protein